MIISAPFIHRPVATTLLTVAIALAGAIAFEVLPVAPLPEVDFPTISVSSGLPGASADIMASSVATPLERQLGHIAGVTEMTSSSTLGSTSITIQFDLSRDIDGAARDVEAAINAARTYLPANLPGNPTYRKVNPADSPIMILGLTSDKYGPDKMYDSASTVLAQKLSQIQGVGQVGVGGGALPSVRVEANPTQLAGYGLTIANLQSVLSLQNSDLAKGQISDGTVSADILANDQLSLAKDYKPLIVGYSNGAAVRLSDVAQVTDSVQNVRAAGYLNGKRSVTVIIFRQPGANIIDTVDRIRAQLPYIQASIPLGMDATIVLDRTTTIRASVSDVERTLLISIGLVIIVVFVFLRNGRAIASAYSASLPNARPQARRSLCRNRPQPEEAFRPNSDGKVYVQTVIGLPHFAATARMRAASSEARVSLARELTSRSMSISSLSARCSMAVIIAGPVLEPCAVTSTGLPAAP